MRAVHSRVPFAVAAAGVLTVLCLSGLGIPGVAVAGVHPPAHSPGRLPGDHPPPRWMLLKPPPVPTPGHPGPDMRDHAAGPPLSAALAVAKAALAACTAEGHAVGVAVIDSSGEPRVALVADGALGGNVYTAVRKGLTALAFQEPTSQVSAQLQTHQIDPRRITADMVPWAGAVPLWREGRVVGAVAVSGSKSTQDEACARAGREVFVRRLAARHK